MRLNFKKIFSLFGNVICLFYILFMAAVNYIHWENYEKTIGIVGYGSIALLLATVLSLFAPYAYRCWLTPVFIGLQGVMLFTLHAITGDILKPVVIGSTIQVLVAVVIFTSWRMAIKTTQSEK